MAAKPKAAARCFEIPSPFEEGGERVLLLDAPDDPEELRRQLLNDRYPRPFVIDDGERRWLHFDRRLVQSAMRLDAPNALDVRYTQKMMSFLLFQPKPQRIVLIGLGGGSLVKFCRSRLPATHLTVVEIDPDVIALRDAFWLPPDGPNLRTVQADGAAYLEEAEKGIDVLLLDAFDRRGYAPSLACPEFLRQAKVKLAGSGVLVANLAGNAESRAGLVGMAMDVFERQVVVFPVREDDSHVLLAFKDERFEPDWRRLHNRAKELRAKYGLDFPVFAEKIERAMKEGAAQRAAERGG